MGLCEDAKIEHAIIGGPMYPCSNPELVAAVSEAGGIGIVQPITLTYVCGYDFREGLAYIKSLTSKPIGMNVLIESSSQRYHEKMQEWIDIALDEGVRFFITSLGKPDWVVKKVHAYGAKVYHDVTEKKWADIAVSAEVDGLIAVNNRAGGHAGTHSMSQLMQMLKTYELPVVCAGGVASSKTYQEAKALGYSGVQIGTRLIATFECDVSLTYKHAIISAHEEDIVLSKKLTGINVSVIRPMGDKDLDLGGFLSWALSVKALKKVSRIFLALRSLWYLKHRRNKDKKDTLWQAGKSVQEIDKVQSVSDVFKALLAK